MFRLTGGRNWLVAAAGYAILLAVCWGLRVAVAARGGQDFWPDEFRYFQAADAARDLRDGPPYDYAAKVLFGTPEHAFFRWWGLFPGWWEASHGRNPTVVAAFMSLFSVACIGLVGVIAHRAGAGRREVMWAVAFAASATTLLFYGRHFLPYDLGMAAILAGLAIGIATRSLVRIFVAGVAVGTGFLTYNGYWLLGGVCLILVVVSRWDGRVRLVLRGFAGALGLILPGLIWWSIGRSLGFDTWQGLMGFSGSIVQGDFGLGYRVITEYFWSAEGLWLLPVGIGCVAAGVTILRSRKWDRAMWWMCGLAAIAGGLVFFSDVVHKFTVYGRLARSMTPFLCLAASAGSAMMAKRWTALRRLQPVLALGLLAVAFWNFAPVWEQKFPDEVIADLRNHAVAGQEDRLHLFRSVRVQRLWGVDVSIPLPPHEVVWRAPHPMDFRPYRYEGYNVAQREAFDANDISMRLIRLTGVETLGSGEGGYPGPLRISAVLAPGLPGQGMPLVSAGRQGFGSVFYLRPVGIDEYVLGFDNWGYGGAVSEPFKLATAESVQFVLLNGSQLPNDARYADWGDRVIALVNGKRVLDDRSPAHRVDRGAFFVGANLIHATTAGEAFPGEITKIEQLSLADFAAEYGP